jgi:hypothetical protein
MSVAPPSGQNRIMIYGPKDDGTYVVEFRTVAGEALALGRENGIDTIREERKSVYVELSDASGT